MTKFKDVAHLYLGCKIYSIVHGEYFFEEMTGVNNAGFYMASDDDIVAWDELPDNKPILRPLSDMTDQESKEYCKLVYGNKKFSGRFEIEAWMNPRAKAYHPSFHSAVERINWLRKMGFDCDTLIESGEAFDKTKLNNNKS